MENDIVADAKAWLADIKGGQRLQTHSEECHRWHWPCLVAKLIREVELQRACTSAGRDEIARVRGGWTSVSELLPPDGEMALWWNPKDDYCKHRLAARDGNGLDWGGDLLEPIAAFTHWRPLPGPPSPSVK